MTKHPDFVTVVSFLDRNSNQESVIWASVVNTLTSEDAPLTSEALLISVLEGNSRPSQGR